MSLASFSLDCSVLWVLHSVLLTFLGGKAVSNTLTLVPVGPHSSLLDQSIRQHARALLEALEVANNFSPADLLADV